MHVSDITAVIVTFNRLASLKTTVERYLEEGAGRVIIIDNGSSDGTSAFLAAMDNPAIVTITLPFNTGGAGGFYTGLKFVRDRDLGKWIVLSDDDSYPAPGALQQFCDSLEIDTNLVSSAVYQPDGAICKMNTPMVIPSLWSLFSKKSAITALEESAYRNIQIRPVLASSFVGMFISINALKQSQILPCPDYFLYWDDIGFCLDLQKIGFGNRFNPNVRFVHHCSRGSSRLNEFRYGLMVRNGYRVMVKLPLVMKLFAFPVKTLCWIWLGCRTGMFGVYFSTLTDGVISLRKRFK